MIEEDTKVDSIENGGGNVGGELVELKKEMIGHVIDKMKENNNDDLFLNMGEDFIVDYLLDEGDVDDKVSDFFMGKVINLFSGSADQLNDLREKIRETNTKEDLDNLEKIVIEDLSNQSNGSPSIFGRRAAGAGAGAYVSSQSYSGDSNRETSSTIESAQVGEAKEVPLKERMHWLFPKGVPMEEAEMRKYITKIKVPIRTPEGETKQHTLTIHKKLANEYMAIFQEMYDKGIPVNPEKTGGYNWRKVRRGSNLSHHSYGSAVDVNWDVNGGVYGTTDKKSPYYNSQDTVAIWKKHGFYRGGDWSAKSDDPMHFTYMNG